MAAASASGALGAQGQRQRDDFVASILASWMVLGLVIDAWNHVNLQDGRLGAFLTPWHGILYAGFTACACWILTRGQQRGEWHLNRMPRGWNIALVGMGLATVGVVGDSVWHTLFGVEADVARMLAPFHLFLYIGVALVASCAARSGWLTLGSKPRPTELVPVVISIITVTIVAGFTVQYLSPFMTWFPDALINLARARSLGEMVEVLVVGGVVTWTVVLFGPVLLMARRWHLPAGAASLVLLGSAGAIASITEFSRGYSLIAIAAAAVVYELVAMRFPHRRVAVPSAVLVMWLGHFGILANVYHMRFPIEIWLGAVGMGLLTAYTVAVLAGKPIGPRIADEEPHAIPADTVAYVQRFADLVSALERRGLQPVAPANVDELFATLADAASLLTVSRVGVRVDERVRLVLFNLTARAEIVMRRYQRAQALASSPSVADMASATLRHLERNGRTVIDLTEISVGSVQGKSA